MAEIRSHVETPTVLGPLTLPEENKKKSVQFSETVLCRKFTTSKPAARKPLRSPSRMDPTSVRSVLRRSHVLESNSEEDDLDFPLPPPDDSISSTNQRLISAVAHASVAEDRPAILDDHSPGSQIPIGNSRALGAPAPNIASDQSGRALNRNLIRLQSEIRSAEEMLGESTRDNARDSSIDVPAQELSVERQEHLPNDPSQIFTRKISRPPLLPPKHVHRLDTLVSICERKVPTPNPSPFTHLTSMDSAISNSEWIAKFDFDLQALFDAHPKSTISPGSEFRAVEDIKRILGEHPFWDKIDEILTEGARYTFKTIPSEVARKRENDAILEYGNHSSARKKPEALRKVMAKDSKFGYACPITFDCARKLKNGRAGPLGVAQHNGIDEKGEIITKDRLAHDQTFSFGYAPSLNLSVDESVLIDLVYGWCLDRLIHQMVALRRDHPETRILICKFDWGSAYRRINGDGTLVAGSITTDADGEFANILLRLSFGGKPHPALFSTMSEAACDFCNDLVDLKDWHPDKLNSPLQRLMGPIQRADDSIPFAQGKELAVDVEPRPEGFHDVYLDDMVQLFLDQPETVKRASGIVPFVLHAMVRPTSDDEPIPRNDILAEDKMLAEGSPSEEMRVLGWLLDSRRLLIRLPTDKFINWSKSVDTMLNAKTCTFQAIDSLVGKLVHATKRIPLSRYFTKRIRRFLNQILNKHKAKQEAQSNQPTENGPKITGARKGGNRPKPWFRYKFPDACRPDLHVWKRLLKRAHDGVSFNLLTCRRPTQVFIADSCPFGMGGFSVRTGKAWHCELDPDVYALAGMKQDMKSDEIFGPPDHLLSNNLYEFICQVVSIWIACLDGSMEDEACVLSLSDSSSATGWLHRSSFGVQKTNHQRVSEKITYLALDHNFMLHPEHIPGRINNVTDMLSRTFDCCDDILTARIRSLYPSQVPANFQICPLPSEIKSWLSLVAPLRPESSSEKLSLPMKTKTEHGDAGSSTSSCSDSPKTPFWTASRPFSTDHRSSARSCNDSVTELGAEGLRTIYERALLKKPLATWHRSSGITTGRAPATSRAATGSTPS